MFVFSTLFANDMPINRFLLGIEGHSSAFGCGSCTVKAVSGMLHFVSFPLFNSTHFSTVRASVGKKGMCYAYNLKKFEPTQQIPEKPVMRNLRLQQLHLKQKAKVREKDSIGATGITFFMSLPVTFDPFVCCTREIPHNYNNGFFRNVFLESWKKKNLTAFAEMDSISDQVRLPSSVLLFNNFQEQKPRFQVL